MTDNAGQAGQPAHDERGGIAVSLRGLDPRQLGLPIAVIALFAYFSIASTHFFDSANFQNIARQGSALTAVAIGQTFVVLTAGIELSVGATVGLVSVVVALATIEFGLVVGLLIGLGAAAAVGLINGTVVSRLGVAPFVATLAMLSAAAGVALMLSGGVPVSGLPESIRSIATSDVAGVPVSALIAFGLLLLAAFILRWTRLGRYIYAVGGNAEAARLAGIPVSRVLVSAYVLCSLFTAVGAVILTARVSSGQPNLGGDLALQSIAAVVIGGVSLFGGRGNLIGVAFGAVFISVLANGLNLLNVASYMQMLVIGVALVAAVALDRFMARRSGEE